jgi:ribonuclease T2
MKRLLLSIGLLTLAGCDLSAVRPDLTPTVTVEACVLPAVLPAPEMERVEPDEVVADRPILFHMLAVTWMPETCRNGGDGQGDLACDGANRFDWTLHGLWPNSDGRPYPRYCKPATRVSDATIRAELCRTPSVDLVQHEWAAHGVCGWETPEAYFAQSATLYDSLKRPAPRDGMTAGRLRDAFAAANPGLPRDAVFVATADGDRLREVRICHDLSFRPRPCPGGALGAPDATVLTVERVRESPSAG